MADFNKWYHFPDNKDTKDLYTYVTTIPSGMQNGDSLHFWGWYLESGNLEPDMWAWLKPGGIQQDPKLSKGQRRIIIRDLFTIVEKKHA